MGFRSLIRFEGQSQMRSDVTGIIETVLINLAFAQAELALSDDLAPGIRRAFEHIKLAVGDLASLAPNFGSLEEEAA